MSSATTGYTGTEAQDSVSLAQEIAALGPPISQPAPQSAQRSACANGKTENGRTARICVAPATPAEMRRVSPTPSGRQAPAGLCGYAYKHPDRTFWKRMETCQNEAATFRAYLTNPTELVGTATIYTLFNLWTTSTRQTVKFKASTLTGNLTGVYSRKERNRLTGNIVCTGRCDDSAKSISANDKKMRTGTFTSSGRGTHHLKLRASYKYLPPGTWPTVPETVYFVDRRCENHDYFKTRYGGCVSKGYRPTFKFSASDKRGVKESARHILRAQKNLRDHWGAHYKDLMGKPIQRWVYDGPSWKNPNRVRACRGFVKRNDNDSCDEYPFATTRQGPYFIAKSRTSVGHVPVLDNKMSGSLLSSFYATARVLDGEKYWVVITK
ncbi:NucA/NucB deoxyribonuclease domain-containing protein [Nocardioides speluncae]|uniref:NucA/NucB deoxyribonuclease domain-containing protein n=1 Tax=Nocardioides speluncae TaxID=2670337 RepID=UPI0019803B71|nr:NucA/NucB deoxyribonuclease domain-containing protein [Nocardioides speluncae]